MYYNKEINKYIEHTLLKAEASKQHILNLCEEAKRFGFFGVCVNSRFVSYCKEALNRDSVRVISVVGFPLGAMATSAKAFETKVAINDGADEIDMVLSIGALKDGELSIVQDDIHSVVEAAQKKPVKVIIETFLLSQKEKELACSLSLKAGAQFVKTCTGFNGGGATVEDILMMKQIVGSTMQVKASGGIKTMELAQKLIEAGATRLGTSSGIDILSGTTSKGGDY